MNEFQIRYILLIRKSSRGDFVFSADRLIRLVVEEGLNQLPYTECTVTTPTGMWEITPPLGRTGSESLTTTKIMELLQESPSVIILLSLFSTPHGAKSIIQEFPEITILTTEVHPVAPTHFGQKYFGTD
ncbi:uracil phosphoribosyltransferase homolog [Athene cunicularia]|uniref:uracil phosphoribosyltransferase homolog n=1 Tax=Athene cunicularia TaxID=194338 RepID=UPI000EF6B719|nr:uracil phosphoribosyltransferase homolog [Athene cunicularia]